MPNYVTRKKVVEAVRWTGAGMADKCPEWFVSAMFVAPNQPGSIRVDGERLEVRTADGLTCAYAGDYVVRDENGSVYAVKAERFEDRYERAAEAA